MKPPRDVTALLREASEGRKQALDELMPVVYEELRKLAHAQLAREDRGHTLNTTALVHEAYVKLAGLKELHWQHRAHFFGVAARVMRRVLIDYARGRKREKRGGKRVQVTLTDDLHVTIERPDELLEVDEALTRLEALDERQCRVVECRFFAGLTIEQTAEALGVSTGTVKRDWLFARAWLNRELGDGAGAESSP